MKKQPPSYTINLSDYQIDWSTANVSYSITYTIDTDPLTSYNRIDAEFDKLEDQTSIAKQLLNDIGIKVK